MHLKKHKLSNALIIPKFRCDAPLSEELKKYPMLPNSHFSMCVIGRPKSGKTSWTLSLFNKKPRIYYKCFSNVFSFIPLHSRRSLAKDIFQDISEDKKFFELTDENLQEVKFRCEDAAEDDETNVIIFDDMAAHMKDSSVQTTMREIIYNRRHIRTSLFILLQNYNSLPLSIRKVQTHFVLFKCGGSEYRLFCEENLSHLSKEQHREIYNICFNEPHSYLYYDSVNGKIYRKFDEIILDDENNEEK